MVFYALDSHYKLQMNFVLLVVRVVLVCELHLDIDISLQLKFQTSSIG